MKINQKILKILLLYHLYIKDVIYLTTVNLRLIEFIVHGSSSPRRLSFAIDNKYFNTINHIYIYIYIQSSMLL